MAQTGYNTIQLYYSTTASAVPSASNLALGELAINITDGKLFYKDNLGVVQQFSGGGGGGMVYPGAGIPNSTGSAWGTSYSTSGSGTVVALATASSLSGVTLNDGYTEEVYAIPSSTTPALSPTNGSIQTWTLTGNSTPTAGTWNDGQSMVLMINDSGSSFTVTWTSLPVTWVGGSAPSLAPASGFTIITLWEVGSTIYGSLVGQVA